MEIAGIAIDETVDITAGTERTTQCQGRGTSDLKTGGQ